MLIYRLYTALAPPLKVKQALDTENNTVLAAETDSDSDACAFAWIESHQITVGSL